MHIIGDCVSWNYNRIPRVQISFIYLFIRLCHLNILYVTIQSITNNRNNMARCTQQLSPITAALYKDTKATNL